MTVVKGYNAIFIESRGNHRYNINMVMAVCFISVGQCSILPPSLTESHES